MRQMKKLLIGVIVLGALGAAGWTAWPKGGKDDKKVETKKAKAERGDIVVYVSATGEIKPVRVIELKSKASGLVVRFPKLPGDPVSEGELLVELDKKLEQRNLDRENSNLATAEAQLQILRLQALKDLKQNESDLAASREDEKQKAAELKRIEKLSGELITENELGQARLAARLSEEKAKQADAALALVRGRKDSDEKLAMAEVERARVAVEDAKERLADTELHSPMKGILLKKLIEEGTIVASGISATTGGTSIAMVADVSKLYVEANVDETDIPKVRKGQPAEVTLTSGSQDKFQGTVELIPPQGEVDSNVIVFKTRVAIDGNVFGRAYSGMTGAVKIKVEEKKQVLLLPAEAIKFENGNPVVYVPEGEGSKAVPVKLGLDNGVKTEILEGLAEGAEVYITHVTIPDPKGRTRIGWR
jgi:multidrug efflux pump subunit AcrA (membrane-fusion protein)